MSKLRVRPTAAPQVSIRTAPVPEVTAAIASILERIDNLGATAAEKQMVADGIARGLVAKVSAYSLDRNGEARDAAVIHVRAGARTPGRCIPLDTSGRSSIAEQIDRGDAELLKDQMRRFSRSGRTTRTQLTFTDAVYANPDRYSDAQRSLGTQAAEPPPWKNGGAQKRVSITPAKLNGTVITDDYTYNRRR